MSRLCALMYATTLSATGARLTAAQTVPTNAAAPRPVPTREVAINAMSTEAFMGLPSAPMVHALPSVSLLVNDWGKQRLIVLDSTLQSIKVMADLNGSTSTPYPGQVFPLLRFKRDSSLLPDFGSNSLLVVDPSGNVVRALAMPNATDLVSLAADELGHPGVGTDGNLYYRAGRTSRFSAKEKLQRAGVPLVERQRLDSALLDTVGIVRANFDTRTVDTVASFVIAPRRSERTYVTPDGKAAAVRQLAPFAPGSDDWGTLSDGTIAILRAHDYHVDFVAPDGRRRSGPKLPYYARRLNDADKMARIDSMKKIIDSVNSTGTPYGRTTVYRRTPEGAMRLDTVTATIAFDALDRIPDYLPAVRDHTMQIDNADRIWVLPTALPERVTGTLYDVIDRNGALVERVHFPEAVVVLAFGRDGEIWFAKAVPNSFLWTIGRGRLKR